MLCKVVLSFQSVVKMKSYDVTVHLKATEHIFLWHILLWTSVLDGQYFLVNIAIIFSASYLICIFSSFFLFKDHNYGQPPPMTPPDSNSPGPEDGDTGNEDEEDDGVTRCIW